MVQLEYEWKENEIFHRLVSLTSSNTGLKDRKKPKTGRISREKKPLSYVTAERVDDN